MPPHLSLGRLFFLSAGLVFLAPILVAQSPCNVTITLQQPPEPGSVTLSWANALPSGTYRLTSCAGTVSLGSGTTSRTIPFIPPDVACTWYIEVNDPVTGSWSGYGIGCTFQTVPHPPLRPIQPTLEPIDGSVGVSTSVVLSSPIEFWQAGGGQPWRMEFQISTNPDPSGASIIQGASGAQSSPTQNLQAGTTYYWRARGVNTGGAGPWSDVVSFSTASVPTTVNMKAFLQGPLDATTLKMNDALRTSGAIPSSEPYSALGYFLNNSGANIGPLLLLTTGDNAIVDWVVIEARHGTTNEIIAQWAALVQRDGDVVMPNGSVPNLTFPMGQVKIGVRHRNHLGVMTATNRTANGTAIVADLTQTSTMIHGTEPTKTVSGRRALWAGDCNGDGIVSYTGSGNDRDNVLFRIGGTIPTNSVSGYHTEDVNLSGATQYTGSGNDRDIILSVIGGVVPTNLRVAQLP